MDNETANLIVKALHEMDKRISSVEAAQQLIAITLRGMSEKDGTLLATNLRNIINSHIVEGNEIISQYFVNLADHLEGKTDTPIIGLLKSSPPPAENEPIPWLRAVIDGGKTDSKD